MDATFDDRELLLRAVWPADRRPDFWNNGRLSSAALKDKRGLSVNRTSDLPVENAVSLMSKKFSGLIVSISVVACKAVDAYVKYCPSNDNIYHSEIHGSPTQIVLSDTQALILARRAKIELER